jgi:hypothetical protein
MSSIELLAKIDALDWDRTVSPATTILADDGPGPRITPLPKRSWSVAQFALAAALLCVVATMLYVALNRGKSSPVLVERPPVVAAVPGTAVTSARPQPANPAASDAAKAAAAAEERRTALLAQAEQESAQKANQRVAERKQRKAREAEQARLEQLERERRQAAEARERAEREAAEARAAKAREPVAAPAAPASPKELCGAESNAFTRGFCEGRACAKAEWRNHPFCQKRLEDQLRSLNQGQGG